jgi:vancomycin resistance protein VanJ
VQARVRLNSGLEFEVISLRLAPALVRLDLWSPDCWREQSANRQARRRQLQRIVDPLADVPATSQLIVGGDFNAPAGDAVFRLLRPRLEDAFEQAGRGWGNTITSDAPFHRIDQVWTSPELRATDVRAERSEYSDHRMVVCDLILVE